MDWICFGDSAMGMLRLAMPLTGEKSEETRLIGLIDDLSIGDISDLNDRKARAFGICPWKNDPEFAGEAERCVERYYERALPAFAKTKEAVIWYGDNPAEQCGMLRAAHDLYARGAPFSLVHVDQLRGDELPPPGMGSIGSASTVVIMTDNRALRFLFRHTPQFVLQRLHQQRRKQHDRQQRQAQRVIFCGVGELEPEIAGVFYRKRRRVRECEAKLLYTRWEQLVQENAPLRVLEQGKPVSGLAEYYDAAILANVPATETVAAWVVGRTLGRYAINDCQIFERIRALAAAGKLEIVRDGANYRETTVRKRKEGKRSVLSQSAKRK